MVLSVGRAQGDTSGSHCMEWKSAWSLGVTPDGQRGLHP